MSMKFDDVIAAIASWRLEGVVSASIHKGKVLLEVDGEGALYPCWLAVQKVDQIGAERGCL
jgi:hypothetical protein